MNYNVVLPKDYFLHAHILHFFEVQFGYVFCFDMGTYNIGILENLLPDFYVNTHYILKNIFKNLKDVNLINCNYFNKEISFLYFRF